MLLFAGIIVFREYQFYTILQAGYSVLYFGLLIAFLLALRRCAEDSLKELERLGFVVLLNEHVIIQCGKGRILLGGITDYRASLLRRDHLSDPFAAIAGARPCDYKILLAHRPKSVYKAAEAGFDLQLSGHTHGGQFIPFKYIVALTFPYVSGLYKYKNTQLFVNQGTGHWGLPIRFGVPAEITCLKLMRA